MTTRTKRPAVRFRRSASLAVAAGIATIGAIPLLAESLWFLPILPVPIAVAVWAWRAGTDVDDDGFTVRALLGSRRVSWQAVDGLVSQDGSVQARLANGHFVKLDAVRPDDIQRITALTGQ
ncbi:PH domain-containing protein [Dactylosporangium sp. NPDC005555]|uniref:PH domain-containing protein n=1 Tax=Dactylosporangium sp. NPDC005555 TaxID=3154889 RepID=UPI0033B2F56E